MVPFLNAPRRSWGRPAPANQQARPAGPPGDPGVRPGDPPVLPYGGGRSYGDVCLNGGGRLLETAGWRRVLDYDPVRGLLRAEAGLTVGDALEITLKDGWVLPVTPGTRHATLGGCLANDVHGKNPSAGTFGAHVPRFELERSDGARLECRADVYSDYFAATIGGLGLTGLVRWVETRLRRAAPAALSRRMSFPHWRDLVNALAAPDPDSEYRVAWLDGLDPSGRGVLYSGSPAASSDRKEGSGRGICLDVPVAPPIRLVRPWTVRCLNALLYAGGRRLPETVSWHRFLFSLDAVGRWNRLYGPRGFVQYHSVLTGGARALEKILKTLWASDERPYFVALKFFEDRPSPGLLSFPRSGLSVALDFPRTRGLPDLLDRLDGVVEGDGGRLYPAKDDRMPARLFKKWYPGWEKVEALRDPAFNSDFWRRVTAPRGASR